MPPLTTNPFDHASRSLLRRAGLALLCWLLKVSPAMLRFVRWLDTRLTIPELPERVCDTVAHVQRLDQGGYPWAIPVEFQVEPDAEMFGRAMVYEGMIWLQAKPTQEVGDRFDLLPVIVNLTGVGRCARRMPWLPGAETTIAPIEWNFETLDADLILAAVARGEAPLALLAWMSLMKKGNDPGTIQRWLAGCRRPRERPPTKGDLALVVVFADLTSGTAVWDKALEGFNVIESPTVNKYMAQAAVTSKVEAIIRFLLARFDSIPADVRARIEATTSLDTLNTWVTLAGKAGSLDDFLREARV